MEPIVAQVQYQLQPVMTLKGDNWAIFEAAFMNYARHQQFAQMLGEEGAVEPEQDVERWRRKKAQATTALTSGWVSQSILDVFRYSANDNAFTLWKRISHHYGNVTDARQLTLRDRVERFKQRGYEPLMDYLGGLNKRMAELEASGHVTDDAYRKMILKGGVNDRIKPIVTQLVLLHGRGTYEDLCLALLEAVSDMGDRTAHHSGQQY